MTMTHASLFSGIGGFDLAAEWAGWTNLFNCEIDPFGQTVLEYFFPKSKQYADIRDTDFTVWRGRIDVLTGGFPCQPFSVAGKRKGTEDERHLWPEMLRAIREIRPRWVVGENVLGIVNWDGGLVFEQVHLDLEAEGYEVQSYVLPACGVDAPHKRYRTWFVAHLADGSDAGAETMRERQDGVYAAGLTPDTKGSGRAGRCCESDGQIGNPSVGSDVLSGAAGLGRERIASDPDSIILGKRNRQGEDGRSEPSVGAKTHYSAGFWDNFPTQSPIRTRNDGFPIPMDGITLSKWRQESIKAYGNAIVLQLVYWIFQTINEYELTALWG